jgi:hypothetical protein
VRVQLRCAGAIALTVAGCLASGSGTASATSARRVPKVTLEWVGDIALSTQRGLPPGGVARALSPVARSLRAADITTGNLEGTFSVGGASKCSAIGGGNCFAFQAPPSSAFEFRGLGFDVLNQANNHSLDYGYSGRAQTVAALNRAGIQHTGYPGEITLRRVNGIRVAFLGFAPYANTSNLLDLPTAVRLVSAARREAAIVVVFIHAGAEGAGELHTPHGPEFYLGEARGHAREFAHTVIRAGASIVLGSGPHVIRGVEDYRGRMVAYSLGNFVGYHTLGGGGVLSESAILRVTLEPGGRIAAADWIPVALTGGLPHPDPIHASAHLVRRLSAEDFPGDHFDITPSGVFRLPRLR